jgi:DNA-binding PadR family transcriptional regulator
LKKNGYIISEHTSSNITFYKITQKGIDEYEKWIKNFLDFARNTNIGGGSITNELSDDDSNRSIVL